MPSADFEKAVAESKQLKEKPTNDELLQLYAYFKQTRQDPKFEDQPQPGTFDFKGKAKHKEWKKIIDEGVTPQQADESYVKLVNGLKDKYGFDPNKKPEAVGS